MLFVVYFHFLFIVKVTVYSDISALSFDFFRFTSHKVQAIVKEESYE